MPCPSKGRSAHVPSTQRGKTNREALLALVLVATTEVRVSSLYLSEEHRGSEKQYSRS